MMGNISLQKYIVLFISCIGLFACKEAKIDLEGYYSSVNFDRDGYMALYKLDDSNYISYIKYLEPALNDSVDKVKGLYYNDSILISSVSRVYPKYVDLILNSILEQEIKPLIKWIKTVNYDGHQSYELDNPNN